MSSASSGGGPAGLARVQTDDLPVTEAAKILVHSGLCRDGKDLGKLYAKIKFGRDLRISDVAAVNGIGIGPQGTIILSAALMAALIKRSGKYRLFFKQRDAKGCTIEVFEKFDGKWESCGVPVSFTAEDAARAGLAGKETYRKFPVDMYVARCLAAVFRTYCSDCGGGAPTYTPEEIDGSGYRTDPATMAMIPDPQPDLVTAAGPVDVKPLRPTPRGGGSQPDLTAEAGPVDVKPPRAARGRAAARAPAPTQTSLEMGGDDLAARVAEVESLIAETGADRGRVLAHYGVADDADWTADSLAAAKALLELKKAAASRP